MGQAYELNRISLIATIPSGIQSEVASDYLNPSSGNQQLKQKCPWLLWLLDMTRHGRQKIDWKTTCLH